MTHCIMSERCYHGATSRSPDLLGVDQTPVPMSKLLLFVETDFSLKINKGERKEMFYLMMHSTHFIL